MAPLFHTFCFGLAFNHVVVVISPTNHPTGSPGCKVEHGGYESTERIRPHSTCSHAHTLSPLFTARLWPIISRNRSIERWWLSFISRSRASATVLSSMSQHYVTVIDATATY